MVTGLIPLHYKERGRKIWDQNRNFFIFLAFFVDRGLFPTQAQNFIVKELPAGKSETSVAG